MKPNKRKSYGSFTSNSRVKNSNSTILLIFYLNCKESVHYISFTLSSEEKKTTCSNLPKLHFIKLMKILYLHVFWTLKKIVFRFKSQVIYSPKTT